MAKEVVNVNLDPLAVLSLLNDKLDMDKVDSSLYEIGSGKYIVNAVYEKFFFRTSSKGSLVITADNVNDSFTKVKIVTTGTAQSMEFDWGAGKSLVKRVKEILGDNLTVLWLLLGLVCIKI